MTKSQYNCSACGDPLKGQEKIHVVGGIICRKCHNIFWYGRPDPIKYRWAENGFTENQFDQFIKTDDLGDQCTKIYLDHMTSQEPEGE